jgi:IS5 family transposase
MSLNQLEMVSLEDLVPKTHIYRKFVSLLDFGIFFSYLNGLDSSATYKGYGSETLFKCLILQHLEDLSDREMERYLQENTAAKWFCGFSLTQKTPDFSLFSRFRKRLGVNKMAEIFEILRNQLKKQGFINEVFSFIDASHLIAKSTLWEERDEAIKQKYERLNNENVSNFAADEQAKFGCKGKNKWWFGYKKHALVDMQSGMINKVALTPANITDSAGFGLVCPAQGAVYADKGYCIAPAPKIAKENNVHLRAIKKNNMIGKNKDLDKWISKIRAPYERVFSKENKRTKYQGTDKNQLAELAKAFCHNIKRLVVINMQNLIPITP